MTLQNDENSPFSKKIARFCKLFKHSACFYVIFFKEIEFCSCSPREMCKFQIDGDKADTHASMLYFLRASVCRADFLVGLWLYDQRATARLGRGSFAFIVY